MSSQDYPSYYLHLTLKLSSKTVHLFILWCLFFTPEWYQKSLSSCWLSEPEQQKKKSSIRLALDDKIVQNNSNIRHCALDTKAFQLHLNPPSVTFVIHPNSTLELGWILCIEPHCVYFSINFVQQCYSVYFYLLYFPHMCCLLLKLHYSITIKLHLKYSQWLTQKQAKR